MTPNIAERVELIYKSMYLHTDHGVAYTPKYDEDKQFLLSLVDKYQKLVGDADSIFVHMYCRSEKIEWRKVKKASGLFEDKKVGG